MATTLANMRDKVRRRSDMVSSQHVTDTDLTDFVNDALADVYGMFAGRDQDWLTADPVSATISSGNTINLTEAVLGARMLRFVGIDYSTGGNWVQLRPFQRFAREIFENTGSSVNGTYRIWYVPEMTKLSTDSDEVHAALAATDIEQYVALRAAISALAKAERDTSVQEREAARLWRGLEFRAATRGQPKTISDYDGRRMPNVWTSRNDRAYRLRGSKVEIYAGYPAA